MSLNSALQAVTERIRRRSRPSREAYLRRLEAAAAVRPARKTLGCANLAHGFAACSGADKSALRDGRQANIAIVSAYNDMLSAHQPLARFPDIIRRAAHEAGAVAQFAGG